MESKDKKLTDLMEGITSGKIQLPDFQRGWVWSDLKIKNLLLVLPVVIRFLQQCF